AAVETWGIGPIRKNRRDWRVAKPTSMPDWMTADPWFELTHPATRYTSAGVIEKKKPISAKNDRPIIVWRISRPVSRSFSPWYRSTSYPRRPNDLDTSIPETDSVSSVIAAASASVHRALLATSPLARPPRPATHRLRG